MSYKKYKDIKEFFKKNIKHLEPSKNLTKKLKHFRLNWSTKDDEYIDFLGSKLLGVHTIRFSTLDDEELMNNVLHIDNWQDLQDEIYLVKGMEKNFNIASNIIYQTLMYLGHLYLKSTLSKKDKEEGIKELCLIMQYKMFASLYSWYFKYKTPENIAITVYNKLSHKFLIKQMDSWQDVFLYRVKRCLEKDNPNYIRLMKFTTEDAIRLVSDIQTKLREQVKQIYKVLIDVIEHDEALTQSSTTYTGGENNLEQLNDINTGYGVYITNLKNIAFSQSDFIDTETLDIVAGLFNNIDRTSILKFLKCMSDDNFVDMNKQINVIEKILLISFTYLQRIDINIEKREMIPKALVSVRFYWSSSKVKNKEMDEIKEELQKQAYKCTGRKTSWLLVALALAYVVYVFLRSLKK